MSKQREQGDSERPNAGKLAADRRRGLIDIDEMEEIADELCDIAKSINSSRLALLAFKYRDVEIDGRTKPDRALVLLREFTETLRDTVTDNERQ